MVPRPGAQEKVGAALKLADPISFMEMEKFFRSGWYSILTDVDGEYLIRRLQDEIRQSESIRGKKNKSNRR